MNWYGSRLFDLKDALKTGENQLTIRHNTTRWNAMGKKPPQPSGLIGPVRLRQEQREVLDVSGAHALGNRFPFPIAVQIT